MSNPSAPRESPCRPPTSPRRRPPSAIRRVVDLLLPAVSALLFLTAIASPVHAASVPPSGTAVHATVNCNQNATCDLDATLTNVQYFLIGIAVLIAGIAFAMFGIQHMAGALEDPSAEKKQERNRRFMTIAVGLAITLLSAVMVGVAKGLVVTS